MWVFVVCYFTKSQILFCFTQVISEGSEEGPAGMTVSLHALGGAEPLLQVKTSAGGSYAFPRVAPGQYELRASHPEWRMAQDRASLAVTADSHQVHGVLAVSGSVLSPYCHFILFNLNFKFRQLG